MAEMNPLRRRMIADMKNRNLSPPRRYADGLEPCRNPAALHNVLGFECIYDRRSAKIESRHVTNHSPWRARPIARPNRVSAVRSVRFSASGPRCWRPPR